MKWHFRYTDSLFVNVIAGLRATTILKQRLWQSCSTVLKFTLSIRKRHNSFADSSSLFFNLFRNKGKDFSGYSYWFFTILQVVLPTLWSYLMFLVFENYFQNILFGICDRSLRKQQQKFLDYKQAQVYRNIKIRKMMTQ